MAMILEKKFARPNLDVTSERSLNDRTPLSDAQNAPEKETALIRVPTARFGTLEVDEDLIITFPDGLIGFESCRRYVVVRHDDTSSFRWLQSLDVPHVAFPIVEPTEFRPDYAPTITDADARFLELSVDAPQILFAVVTIPQHDPRKMTANLLAPLVINGMTHRGKQLIVQNESFTTRHVIVDELLRTTQNAQAAAGRSVSQSVPVTNAEQAA